MAAGGQADGEIGGQLVDRRIVIHAGERCPRPDDGALPQPPVQIELAGMRLVVAGPLETARLLQPGVRHPLVHGRQLAQLVPQLLGRRIAEVAAHAAGELAEDLDVVAHRRPVAAAPGVPAARAVRCWSPCLRTRTSRPRPGAPRPPARPVAVRTMSCTTRISSPLSRLMARCWSASELAGFSPMT